jgi:Zn-dependent protease with chaperone function
VDSVYATPGSNVAVMERGSMLRQIGGKPERCLIVGAAALDGLEQRPFKAILAHEYGHFSNRDTDAGGLALAVRRALFTMAQHLAIAGAATWYSPAWWFVRGFHRVFLRISQGASRLQEVLADRWAAFNYGAASFEKGLSHVVGREVLFGASLTAAVREAVERKTPVPNLYSYRTEKPVDESEISAEIEKALNAEPSPYDSHPAPAHRFRWVHALDSGGAAPPTRDDSEPAWNLFADREAIERQMTDRVRGNLAMNYGVALP